MYVIKHEACMALEWNMVLIREIQGYFKLFILTTV